ncbi:MAG: glutamine-hydrolyzing GMP synthase [Lachnospiraceae bacterium]|nr:glutamine-hydrolyzing GMP synthase [Lachnospiraceae bacterium]
MSVTGDQEKIIVIDFGGQYNQLVARRVRECNVYCEIYSYKTPLDQIRAMGAKGIILTGGPNSCYEEGAPTAPRELFELGIPVLGLCYGAQLMQHVLGGRVERASAREYGKTEVKVNTSSPLFAGIVSRDGADTAAGAGSSAGTAAGEVTTICWMSHFDYISKLAPGFETVAYTDNCPVAAAQDRSRGLYAIQFHPEVLHTVDGKKMLYNFVRGVCGCAGTWRMDSFVESSVKEIRECVGDGRVLLALSGGVDSSVLAALLARAIGPQLTCVFVDHGLMRKNEGDEVEAVFGPDGDFDINFIRVNAADRYYIKLAGVDEPERKRKIIGEEFIRVFEEEAKKIGAVDFLAQGTIYPDVVESGLGGESTVIKSHHNVGGLPDYVDFKEIIEPLRDLFKDEVRKVGIQLGIPDYLVNRQPFPGPGLGIRIVGDVTAEKIRMVQDADAIYREEIATAAEEWRASNLMGEADVTSASADAGRVDATGRINPPWMPDQYFAALTNMRSVGVMGDERTYDYAIALRAVKTIDFMTAEAADIPWEILQKVMSRIINEVRGVNRVFYDLTSKPPGTIELE